MGAPAGPVGCHAPDAMPTWEVGVGWSGFSTELVFDDGQRPSMRQHSASATLTRIYPTGWTLGFSGGATLGGSLDGGWTLDPGWVASVQGSRQWRGAAGAVPFVITSLSLSASRARTHVGAVSDHLLATDARLAGVVGWDVAGVWTPYLALRVFGGPVFWRGAQGTDKHHYNAALGSRVRLGGGVSLFVDASLLGERSLGAGAALSW